MLKKLRSLGLSLIAVLAMSVVPASAAQAAKLTTGPYGDSLFGVQQATHSLLLRDNSNLGFTCSEANMEGAVPDGGTSSPVLHPWYAGCTAFGLKATINTTGCNYRLNLAASSGPEYPGTMDLECSTSGIVLTTLTCEVVFPPQTGILAATGTNLPNGGWNRVLLKMTGEGIDYVVTKDGVGCPLKGKGNYSEAAYWGSTELSAGLGKVWLEP
jgi:hypothetical protein